MARKPKSKGKLGKWLDKEQKKKTPSFFAQVLLTLQTPTKQFNRTQKDNDWRKPLEFVAKTTAILGAIMSIILLFFAFLAGTENGLGSLNFFMLFLLPLGLILAIVISSILGAIISAAILHITIIIFGGKGKYVSALKAVSYGYAPNAIYGLVFWIPLAGILFGIWQLILTGYGLSTYYKTSKQIGVLAAFIPGVLIVLFALVIIGIVVFLVPGTN